MTRLFPMFFSRCRLIFDDAVGDTGNVIRFGRKRRRQSQIARLGEIRRVAEKRCRRGTPPRSRRHNPIGATAVSIRTRHSFRPLGDEKRTRRGRDFCKEMRGKELCLNHLNLLRYRFFGLLLLYLHPEKQQHFQIHKRLLLLSL